QTHAHRQQAALAGVDVERVVQVEAPALEHAGAREVEADAAVSRGYLDAYSFHQETGSIVGRAFNQARVPYFDVGGPPPRAAGTAHVRPDRKLDSPAFGLVEHPVHGKEPEVPAFQGHMDRPVCLTVPRNLHCERARALLSLVTSEEEELQGFTRRTSADPAGHGNAIPLPDRQWVLKDRIETRCVLAEPSGIIA